jgi:hypothetical protein
LQTINKIGFWYAMGQGLVFIAMALFGFCILPVCFILVSLPQFLAFAWPTAHFLSKGIEIDAKRSWGFYIFAGAIIGGGPWLVLEHFTMGPNADLGSKAILIGPGLISGIFAGGILKVRLVKVLNLLNSPEVAEKAGPQPALG